MANRFQKFIYYLTAEAPAFFVLGLIWFIKKSEWGKTIVLSWKVPVFLLFVTVFLIVLLIRFFKKAKSSLSIANVKGENFRSVDGWLVVYVVTYLLPLAYIPWGDVVWIVLILILLILMVVLTFSDIATPHPLLFGMGYHFYELNMKGKTGFIIISKKQVQNVNEFKKVSQLFENLLIETE